MGDVWAPLPDRLLLSPAIRQLDRVAASRAGHGSVASTLKTAGSRSGVSWAASVQRVARSSMWKRRAVSHEQRPFLFAVFAFPAIGSFFACAHRSAKRWPH